MADTLLLYPLVNGILVLGAVAFLYRWLKLSRLSLSHIPSVGYSAPLLSYFSALRYMTRGGEMVLEGYDKYKGGAFKVPLLFNWLVIVTGSEMVEEVRQAGDNELNMDEFMAEQIQTRYTFGLSKGLKNHEPHVIRTDLTRNLGTTFPALRDEIAAAFADAIPPSSDWTKVPALTSTTDVISRSSGRVFIGLPLCRNEDYRQINIAFTRGVVTTALFVRLFPSFLRPLIGPLVTPLPTAVRRIAKLIQPIVEERSAAVGKLRSDHNGNPNDMLSWLMDTSQERDSASLARRILAVNFASIHTTSMTFTHALYRLAAYPEYAMLLREEVDKVVAEEGWTKDSVHSMSRVDSFLKESQRVDGVVSLTISRRAVKDYTFSNGIFIPKGTFISAAAKAIHHDREHYENGPAFNPWRFSDMRADEGETTKYQMASTSLEYLPWGHGKHACPGRFFAVLEMKTMLAHIVMNYDVKLEQERQIPTPQWFSATFLPNRTASVLFRKRLL